MEDKNNASCAICGKKYHVCQSCLDRKTSKPWRTVTDTREHYKIYFTVHGYTLAKNNESAKDFETAKKELKEELKSCDLSDLDEFLPEIKAVIYEILSAPDSIPNKNVSTLSNSSI